MGKPLAVPPDGGAIEVDGVRYRCASSDSDRLAAQRLCYEVFTAECGEMLFANHERATYEDPYDTPEHLHLLAEVGTEVVGTIRVVHRRSGPYLADAMFEWELLAARVDMPASAFLDTVGILSRGAVRARTRRRGIYLHLASMSRLLAARRGLRWLVAVVAPDNDIVIRTLRALGWSDYGIGISARGWQGLRMWRPVSESSSAAATA